jgi:hypothetical protein
MVAGVWFIASGVAMLRQYTYLVPQAKRLLAGDIGATDAPVRALFVLVLGVGLVLLGPVLIGKGITWLRRLRLPPDGPMAIAQDEAIAVLRHHELPSYAAKPPEPNWPLRHLLRDELAELPWWRRDMLDSGVRTFVRSCGAALLLAACWLGISRVAADDVLGPFPVGFVTVLPLVTGIWAALVLLLIAANGQRAESVELPVPTQVGSGPVLHVDRIIENRPLLLPRTLDWLGVTLGLLGLTVQCLILSWWDLSLVSFPLLATSIIRHTGSMAGGLLFFVLGDRMLTTAGTLLQNFRYDSFLVLIDGASGGTVARAAAIRTESVGLTGPRHILAAVGGPRARESALSMISNAEHAA